MKRLFPLLVALFCLASAAATPSDSTGEAVRQLWQLLDYVAVDASGCPGAGPWLRRISLTPTGLAPAHTRLLLLCGQHKRDVFERAMAGEDPREMPVRIAFNTPGAPLQVHWCP